MSLPVVLYAEGAGEDLGEFTWRPPSGHALREEHLGSAHILIRRAIAYRTKLPPEAVQFVSPLVVRARRARGSDLLDIRTLRQLLPSPNRSRPKLAVALVDEDGDKDRGRRLRDATSDPDLLPHVIAVAVREFESWLLADAGAVGSVAGQPLPSIQDVESLEPGHAKAELAKALRSGPATGDAASGEQSRMSRRSIAARSDLALLSQLRSFGTLLHDLASALP